MKNETRSKYARVCCCSFLVIGASLAPASGEPQRNTFDAESTAGFLVGKYVLVGKKPDSDVTYSGRVLIKQRGDRFDVTRTINRQTVHGTAFFEPATPDKIPVLRMRFQFDGEVCEATYLWQGDLDNYARLTGYVYSPTKNKTKLPGLEVLFPAAH